MATYGNQVTTPLIHRTGIPPPIRDRRETYQKRLALYLILASTIFERIAFYILAATLAVMADPIKCNSIRGPTAAYIFTGTTNISSLIFAIISDAKLGRSKTIIIGFILYFTGYLLTTIFTSGVVHECYNGVDTQIIFDNACAPWIFPPLVIIAIGAGAVQSNMAVFGAEQIQESKITSRYFDKYVIAVNIGAILADIALHYIETKNYIAYSYGTTVLFIAALLFIVGHRYYIHVPPQDSIATKCLPVIFNAFQRWYHYENSSRSTYTNQTTTSAQSNLPPNTPRIEIEIEDQRPASFLDFAKLPNGKFLERIVEDVKSLRNALIVFTLLIPYWLIYVQLDSTFRLQAQHMRGASTHSMIIMSIVDPITLIIGIIILILFVYKYLDARNKSLAIEMKILVGMCFAVITMCIAGAIEKLRQEQWKTDPDKSNLGIYNQIPQAICMGLSELLIMVASFEYAYFGAPRSAQTLIMSLRFVFLGIASFISFGYIAVFATSSFHLDFTCQAATGMKWRFYTYFFILAILQSISILIFMVCQENFQIIKLNRQQMQRTHFLQRSSTPLSVKQ